MRNPRNTNRLVTSVLAGLAVVAATVLPRNAAGYDRRVTCGWEMDC